MSRSLIVSTAVILPIGIVAALLWPGEEESGIARLSMPVMVEQSTPASGNANPARTAGQSAGAKRPLPPMGRNSSLKRPDVEALRKQFAEKALASFNESHTPEGLAALRKSLEQRHPDLGKFLGLAPDEQTRLLDVLFRYEVERDKLTAETEFAGVEVFVLDGVPMQVFRDGAQEQRENQSLAQRREEELRSVLGDKYDKWLAYGVTPDIRTSVTRFQDVFGPDANPLSDEQTEAVVAALAAEQVRINRDMSNIPRAPSADPQTNLQNNLDWTLRYASENNRRLVETASPFLNAGQLVDYREMLEEDRNKSIESLRDRIARLESRSAIPRRP